MNELALPIIRTMDDAERAARAMAASGFFADTKQAAQAVVKIMAGQELGFGPFASMTGVHIIQNKPVLAANLMAAAVKRTGKYNYRVTQHTDAVCEITFFENNQEVGRSAFSMDDAKKAGVSGNANWQKYPRNMLFARALSNGQKWYAPDVFNGATVYTPDEMGAPVDEEGNAVITEARSTIPPTDIAETKAEVKPERPYAPEVLKAKITEKAFALRQDFASGKKKFIATERQVLAAALGHVFKEDTTRYELCGWLVDKPSTKDMAPEYVVALLAWLNVKDYNTLPDAMAIKEAMSAHTFALEAKGQLSLEGVK